MTPSLDVQIQTLLDLGYPALAGVAPATFRSYVDPLRDLAADGDLLVVSHRLVPTVEAVERFDVRGRKGWTDMHDELPTYATVEGVDVPATPVYLLRGVGTGPETLGVRPDDALMIVLAAGRTPLTVDEGVALVTQVPAVFRDHNAFQALATRSGTAPYTKRVPSFWMSKGAPRLGWCWAGNPHTWLGAASAVARLADLSGAEVALAP
ncbi:MAG: hypothetical protein HOQ22_00455 [Nocardioidaceae bacterium]|nr:hypothetical protein [Nocardioidaceae bacterium]NUS49499.1 hypothetical protein [Nocardioidaceae bacterium]